MPIHHKHELVAKQPDSYNGPTHFTDRQSYRTIFLHKQECVLFMLRQIQNGEWSRLEDAFAVCCTKKQIENHKTAFKWAVVNAAK